MKKYKEWLTNEIEIMESETSEYYPHEQMVEREVVLNLIDQLDEPEVRQIKELDSYNDELIRDNNQLRNALDNQKFLSQKWIDENSTNLPMSSPMTKWVSASKLQNLIIPKQELPVIPKYVAKYLEFAKKEASLIQVMVTVSEGWPTMKKEFDWISENDETFARAWLDGYEVKEEPLYYVMNNHNRVMLGRMMDGKTITEADPFKLEDMYEGEKKSHRLTEQEIKDYDERYWAFRKPVEELEE